MHEIPQFLHTQRQHTQLCLPMQIAGAVARMGLQPLTQAAREALVQAEDNLLAKMLNEHLVDDAMVEQVLTDPLLTLSCR